MQETMTQVSTQLTDKWNALSKAQKIKLGIGVSAILGAIIIVGMILSRPDMQIVYRNLELKEAAEVTEILDGEKISYTVVDEGRTIQVEKKDLNRTKLILARENVPKGKYNFDDALNNSMSTTEDERRAKINEYKKSELEVALESMDAINKADVTLEIPKEKNSFIASKQQSSASILLTLNHSIDGEQVEGIARFIANSVENLDTKNITIIDTAGNNLYPGQDSESASVNKQQELKIAAEKDIHTKISNLLEPLYDEVRVSPNLILDFNQHEEVREEYTPQFDEEARGIVQSENITNSSSKNSQAGAEPGVANNGGDAPIYQVGGETGGESKSSSKNIQYANNKVVSNSVKNVGDIDYKNSSVAVHVSKNKIYDQSLIEKTLPATTTWEQFKEENKYQVPITIEEAVAESIQKGTGIENVIVYGYEKPVFIDKMPYEINYKDYIPYVLILLILAIIVIAIFKFRKQDEIVETEPELEVEEMLQIAKEEVELEEIELKENLETKRRIEKFVDEKPEAVASLLRNWLAEDEWE